MRLNAASEAQAPLSNGPVADLSLPDSNSLSLPHHPHIALSSTPATSQPSVNPPCPLQPISNGPIVGSPSPCGSGGALSQTERHSVGNNHIPGQGSNGNVPYLEQNALPHKCTTPTSSSSSSNNMNDLPRKSQHANSTQVS